MIPPFSCKTLCHATTERRMKIAQTSTRKLFPMGTRWRRGSSITAVLQSGEAARQQTHPWLGMMMLNHISGQTLPVPGCSCPHYGAGGSSPAVLAQPECFAGTTRGFCQQTEDLSLGQSQPEPGRTGFSSQPQYICTGKRKIPLGQGRESTGTGINSLVIILMIALST